MMKHSLMSPRVLLSLFATLTLALPPITGSELATADQAEAAAATSAVGDCTWSRSDVADVVTLGPGQWGKFVCPVFCPPDTFAYEIILKSEGSQGGGIRNGNDDTALNGVAFFCRERDGSMRGSIFSNQGPWGSWVSWASCPDATTAASPIVGGRIQIEPYQGSGNSNDDTGANAVRATCSDGTVLIPPARTNWGSWGPEVSCPPNTAVCGMATKVEGSQGDGVADDTALNGAELYCCDY